MTTSPRTSTATLLRRLVVLSVAVAVVLGASACATTSPKKANARSEVGSTLLASSSTSVGSKSSAGTDSGSNGSTPTTAKKDKGEVLGSSEGQQPADPNDATLVPLRLDVTSVKRLSGETIEVRFNITNTGDVATFKPYTQLGDSTVSTRPYDVGGLALLDRPHDKKYLTLYGTDNVCLCTGELSNVAIAPGKTTSMYADVTAPPDSVTSVDLSLPGFAPITGLKIR